MKKNTRNKIYGILVVLVFLVLVGCVDQGDKPATEATDHESITETTETAAEVQDCGVSRSRVSDQPIEFNKIDFEADSAMVCMGNNLLNNCRKAKARVESGTGGVASYEILGLKGSDCIVRCVSLESDDPSPEAQKYVGMYGDCPLDIEKLNSDAKKDGSNTPGSFAAGVQLYVGFEVLFEDTECTGTIVDAIRKEREALEEST